MTDAEEKAWGAGNRSAWRAMLGTCLRELGYHPLSSVDEPPPTVQLARLVAQLEDARGALRDVCARHGDNDWSNELNLRDVVDKHLARYLDDDHGHAPREVFISGEPVVPRGTDRGNGEVADIEERLNLLRAASRPSEPLDTWEYADNGGRDHAPTAQGHILSAITQLERRRAELLGKVR